MTVKELLEAKDGLFKPQHAFDTPESFEELQNYIDKFNGDAKLTANIIMMKTWNMCCKMYADHHDVPASYRDTKNWVVDETQES